MTDLKTPQTDDLTRPVVRDRKGTESIAVLYRGDVPDLFRAGREVSVDGRLRNGVFHGVYPLVTKCPSKYTPKS